LGVLGVNLKKLCHGDRAKRGVRMR
jgi:hypothetical protein